MQQDWDHYTDALAFLSDSSGLGLHSNLMYFINYSPLFSMFKFIWKINHQTHAEKKMSLCC